MHPHQRHYPIATLILTLIAGVLGTNAASAQTYPRTRLENVTPPGAKAGTSVEVTLRGNDLDDVKQLQFSDNRIKAEWIAPPKPKIDKKTKKPKKTTPQPPKFKITVPGDVSVGLYDVRAVGKWGVSNPRSFCVGDLTEATEKEANNDVPQAQKIELNTTINGLISGNTDVDYFLISAKKGQRIVIYCAAAEIDSRLDPLLEVYNQSGRQIANNRNYTERNAMIDLVAAEDGDYYIRLCQFAYIFGGTQAFYRLNVSTAPWIDAVYPPVVQPGKATTVTLLGKNLPGGKLDPANKLNGQPLEKSTVQINPPMGPLNDRRVEFSGMNPTTFATIAGFEYRAKNGVGVSNPMLITYSKDPVVVDNEKNDEPEQAQRISLPCTVCGRVEKTGDRDWYIFTAKRGEVYTFEGFAERLGAPSDLYIDIWRITKTTDPKTKKVEEKSAFVTNYDAHTEIPDTVGNFTFRTSDPKGRFAVPADGDYRVMVNTRTSYSRSGPRFVYRLNIRKEEPDYSVILVANDNANAGGFLVHQGGCQEMSVVVLREDGFDGEVLLEVDGLPNGITCPPQVVGNKLKQGYLVLEAADNAPEWNGKITIKAIAEINGKKVVRHAQAGVLVWPAPNNIPAISRMARSIALSVGEKGPFSLSTNVKELEVPVGGRGEIKVKLKKNMKDYKQQVQVVRLTAPALTNGNPANFPNVNIPNGKTEAVIKYTLPTNVVPGVYSLVFQGKGKYSYAPDPAQKNKKRNTDVYEVTPPIKITVYNQVGEFTVTNPKLSVEAGKEVEFVVKIKRLYDYKGDFNVQLKVPGGFGGISAANVKVPKDGNEFKMKIKTAKNAKVGSSPEFIVRATARVGNATFTHETKFELAITKATAALQRTPATARTARLVANDNAKLGVLLRNRQVD